ncbi:MAG: SGNH/GDSL hydrolase family protein [Acetobacteraceae bacterium]|nr:SGNH/GDSL hydrolase family protein [Acetobacteraceae bacterium]
MIARWAVLLWLLGTGAAAAQGGATAPGTCPFPDSLVADPVALTVVQQAVAGRHRLVVMTMGGAPMTGGGVADATQTYPARMQAHLQRLLPGVEVVLANRAVPGRSAKSMARRIGEQVATIHPDLVVWASGGHEAMRNTDPAAYAAVLEAGIAAARAAGADVMLVDSQFAPGFAGLPNIDTYRAVIRTVGELEKVPVFPRYDLMRAWHEDGVLDLQAADRARQAAVARQLFDCIGDGLARLVLAGSH